MEINDYQRLAMTTLNPALDKKDVLINSVMGLCGESGEAIDIVKKWLAQGHELDRARLAKELGDVAWYPGGGGHGARYSAGGHTARQSRQAEGALSRGLQRPKFHRALRGRPLSGSQGEKTPRAVRPENAARGDLRSFGVSRWNPDRRGWSDRRNSSASWNRADWRGAPGDDAAAAYRSSFGK